MNEIAGACARCGGRARGVVKGVGVTGASPLRDSTGEMLHIINAPVSASKIISAPNILRENIFIAAFPR
jgi:hypothetical protein